MLRCVVWSFSKTVKRDRAQTRTFRLTAALLGNARDRHYTRRRRAPRRNPAELRAPIRAPSAEAGRRERREARDGRHLRELTRLRLPSFGEEGLPIADDVARMDVKTRSKPSTIGGKRISKGWITRSGLTLCCSVYSLFSPFSRRPSHQIFTLDSRAATNPLCTARMGSIDITGGEVPSGLRRASATLRNAPGACLCSPNPAHASIHYPPAAHRR